MAYDIKFLKGTSASFEAQKAADSLDKNTFYYVDEKNLYLGDILLSSDEDVEAAVARIKVNEAEIADIKAELDALVDPDGSGVGSITSQIAALRTELTNKINDNYDLITAETDRAKTAEGKLRTNLETVSTDLSNLSSTVSTQGTALNTLSSDVEDLSQRVTDNETDIKNLNNDLYDLTPVISGLSTTSQTHTSQLNTLIGNDANKSVREIALNELATQLIPDNAQEAMDTLEELAAWLQQHPTDAATMNQQIGTNTQNIESLQNTVNDHGDSIDSLQEIIANITHGSTGYLAEAKKYTDEEINKVELTLENLAEDIKTNADAITAINDKTTGILATANANIQTAINNLGLGTAAYANVGDFDPAGSAAAALKEAKEYTDVALTWREIQTVSN